MSERLPTPEGPGSVSGAPNLPAGFTDTWYAWRMLMPALGHQRFAVVGHDTGLIIGYALAADHPDRVDRLVLVEVPGPPGVSPSPPLFVPEPINNRLWHIPFNRVNDELTEQLVRGAESWGEAVGNGIKPAAEDVQSMVIPGAGHWVAEQAPEEMLASLTAFLAPYRVGALT